LVFGKKKEKIYSGSVGGIPFFFSIFCLIIFTLATSLKLLTLIDSDILIQLGLFSGAGLSGAWLSYLLISGKISVLLHEFKHSFVSSLVGNKAKELKVTSKETGHFQYSFTKDTAKFNALISLAPYYLPLFSFPIYALGIVFYLQEIDFSPIILGLAFGADLLLNIRDIGSHQTDFSKITGGFWVGLLFVFLINLAILLVYIAWTSFQVDGFLLIFHGLAEFLLFSFSSDIELI
jgi:hypothetical protein